MTIGGAPITASKKGGGKYILHVLQQKQWGGENDTHTHTLPLSSPLFFHFGPARPQSATFLCSRPTLPENSIPKQRKVVAICRP